MIHSHDDESIVALCTPKGNGAIALLRLSGINAFHVADQISSIPNGKKISEIPTHTIQYGSVLDNQGNRIDQVLFLVMHGPHTFTGQNTVEITCHNNPFIIESIIARTIACGARLAQEGEFTRRAVLNNKIDVPQAEAINELIHANTQAGLKKSLAQLEGSLSSWVTLIEKDLIKALALCEASFEFIDEEMEFNTQIADLTDRTLSTIENVKKSFDQQQQIREGIRIALIGCVNAGKSSLFNALIGKDRAIVTEIPGTTRDVIEAGLYKNGNYWTLIDTAGLRQTDDRIEQEGIGKSCAQAQSADIILLVIDSSRALLLEEKTIYQKLIADYENKIIVVYNKADLPSANADLKDVAQELGQNSLWISGKTGHNIDALMHAIETKISSLFAQADSPFLLNKRQFNLLLGVEKKLKEIQPMLHHNVHYELVSYHLNDALAFLSELTGKSISEAGMDAVFREFCVGK